MTELSNVVEATAIRPFQLNVPEAELKTRLAAFVTPPPHYDRGYGRMFLEHVTQANLGCDFDFLMATKK